MPFKYSVILETLTGGDSHVLEDWARILGTIRDLGFVAVDVPDKPEIARKIRKEADTLGMAIPAVIAAWGFWHCGEERDLASRKKESRERGIAYAKRCIDLTAEIGARFIEIAVVPAVVEYPVCSEPLDILRKNLVQSTGEICHYAAGQGVDILIEPINRFEGYAGFINNFSETLSVIEEIGSPNLGILPDLFHMNIEEASICAALRKAGGKARHMHLADSNRLAPGCGHIDFNAVLRTLAEIGFDGYLALDSIPVKPNVTTFLNSSITYMQHMERAIELQQAIYQVDIKERH